MGIETVRIFTALSAIWLFGVAFAGSFFTECSTLSCVMGTNDLALAAMAQVLAFQAFIGQHEIKSLGVKTLDVTLALGTGLAPYSVAGSLHNYLALALFILRVFHGIQRSELKFNFINSLIVARVLGIVFLHGYGCQRVLPELCLYASWPLIPSFMAIWIQFGFALSGIVSIVLVNGKKNATQWQRLVFIATACYSAVYGILGLSQGAFGGFVLFALAAVFDSYLSWRLQQRSETLAS